MKEIEELLAKLDDGDNQDIHEAILKAFAEKDKRIAELERQLKIANKILTISYMEASHD